MRSDEVTRRQARTIKAALQPTLDYVTRLAARMRTKGFSSDDELMRLVANAEQALHELQNDLLIRTLDGPTAPPAEPPMIGNSKRALEIQDGNGGRVNSGRMTPCFGDLSTSRLSSASCYAWR
jgi:hypothetical protein